MDSHPLVSVVVITYNSSATVVETLESIKQQTYKNIELIVTDDCSTDNSVDICQQWIVANKDNFVHAVMLTARQNTGMSANCNRGCTKATGEWIKLIAADDRLLPNCICDYVNFINDNPDTKIAFSKVIPFGDKERLKDWAWADNSLLFEKFSHRQLGIILCYCDPLPTASIFFRRDTLLSLGGFDENIPLLEDWPLLMRAVNKAGIHISFMNKETAEYRFSITSISNNTYTEQFQKNIDMCFSLGHYYLRKMSPFAPFYFFTVSHANDNILMRCFHFINIFNPFYHELQHVLKLFRKIKKIQHDRLHQKYDLDWKNK